MTKGTNVQGWKRKEGPVKGIDLRRRERLVRDAIRERAMALHAARNAE